jgi:hypothetical protein
MAFISLQRVSPIQHHWHHAVNSQDKLDRALESVCEATPMLQSIEADIIYSTAKQQSVMGHPPDDDGELPLSSFLEQLHHAGFQFSYGKCTNCNAWLHYNVVYTTSNSI